MIAAILIDIPPCSGSRRVARVSIGLLLHSIGYEEVSRTPRVARRFRPLELRHGIDSSPYEFANPLSQHRFRIEASEERREKMRYETRKDSSSPSPVEMTSIRVSGHIRRRPMTSMRARSRNAFCSISWDLHPTLAQAVDSTQWTAREAMYCDTVD